MGLLDQLWDDTVAGPLPENGLGKLRKYPTFSFRQNSNKEMDVGAGKSYSEDSTSEATNVTRRIMIIKPPAVSTDSPPVSPAGSTPPVSPFSSGSWGARGEPNNRFRRRSTSDVQAKRVGAGPRSPTSPYDV
ncbi:hypothetical protein ACHQM5_015209 [Ranunculus cassubicifolius]